MGGHDPLSDALLACFAIGLLSTLGMLLLGHVHHSGGHAGAGHAIAGQSGATAPGASARIRAVAAKGHGAGLIASVFNLSSFLAFLMCGGAAGFVVRHTGGAAVPSIAVGAGGGVLGAYLVAGLIGLLARAEAGTLEPVDPIGTVGKVLAPVGSGRTGEISFVRDGQTRALPARTEDDTLELDRDTEVVVMRVERGIAYVRRATDVFDEDPSPNELLNDPNNRKRLK
jgi:hypothetical protein